MPTDDSTSRYKCFLIRILFLILSVDLLWRVHKPVIRMRMCVWSNTMNIELSSCNIPAFIDSSTCTQSGHEKHMICGEAFFAPLPHTLLHSIIIVSCVCGVRTPLLCLRMYSFVSFSESVRLRARECSAGDTIYRHFAVDLIIIILVIINRLPH